MSFITKYYSHIKLGEIPTLFQRGLLEYYHLDKNCVFFADVLLNVIRCPEIIIHLKVQVEILKVQILDLTITSHIVLDILVRYFDTMLSLLLHNFVSAVSALIIVAVLPLVAPFLLHLEVLLVAKVVIGAAEEASLDLAILLPLHPDLLVVLLERQFVAVVVEVGLVRDLLGVLDVRDLLPARVEGEEGGAVSGHLGR